VQGIVPGIPRGGKPPASRCGHGVFEPEVGTGVPPYAIFIFGTVLNSYYNFYARIVR
jgi:hypothetical protein